MKIPYTITPRGVNLMVSGRPRSIDRSHVNYQALVSELRKPQHDVEAIKELADIATFVARLTFGKVQVADGQVRYDGKPLHHVLADHLLAMLREGHDCEPMGRFLDNLMLNPLESARNELYLWIESGDCAITPDGHFLAYKAVRGDYHDYYTGKLDYSVGQHVIEENVDTDRSRECSNGLHFCSFGYLDSFHRPGGRIVIVKINPADVRAIPHDYANQKGRTRCLDVVDEVPPDEADQFFKGRSVIADYSQPKEEPEIEQENTPDIPKEQRSASSDALDAMDDLHTDYASGINADADVRSDEQKSASSPATSGVPALNVFIVNGKTYSASKIADLVSNMGQRQCALFLGVARSTLQGWLKKIA
jgi:hypothetical protein